MLWDSIPQVSADGPHSILRAGALRPVSEVTSNVDWRAPLFKLTYRLYPAQGKTGTLLAHLLYGDGENWDNDRENNIRLENAETKQNNDKPIPLLRFLEGNDYLRHCKSITKPKRLKNSSKQNEVFIFSKDAEIVNHLPRDIKQGEFVTHFTNKINVDENPSTPFYPTEQHSRRAKLIITTLPDCALSAIAMGIPVVVFYPLGKGSQHQSDLDEFAVLSELVRIFSITEMNKIDWQGYNADMGYLKLQIIDNLSDKLRQSEKLLAPLAPSDELPVPSLADIKSFMESGERLTQINKLGIPDRQRWGTPLSYEPEWNERGNLAAQLIPDNASIFEVGTGLGWFRSLVSERCNYVGADLEPLDQQTLVFNLDSDELPVNNKSHIVLLGVFEYLHEPLEVASKLEVTDNLVISYPCRLSDKGTAYSKRKSLGWANHFSEAEFLGIFSPHSFKVIRRLSISCTSEYEEILLKLRKTE